MVAGRLREEPGPVEHGTPFGIGRSEIEAPDPGQAIAPAHIAQGSSVTQRSHSSSREVPSAAPLPAAD
jgi:hypothetical protein